MLASRWIAPLMTCWAPPWWDSSCRTLIIAVIVTNWSLRRNDSATAPQFVRGREDRLAIFATIGLSECEIISPKQVDLSIIESCLLYRGSRISESSEIYWFVHLTSESYKYPHSQELLVLILLQVWAIIVSVSANILLFLFCRWMVLNFATYFIPIVISSLI